MNRKKNWTKVTVYVVLALTSLASIAMSGSLRGQRTLLAAPVDCDQVSWTRHTQHLSATEWVLDTGTDVLNELSESCAQVAAEREPTFTVAPFGYESGYWEGFAQYQGVTELAKRERTFTVAPFGHDSGYGEGFAQYQGVTALAERERTLTVAPFGHDSGYWEGFAQYQGVTELAERERTFTVAPFGSDSGYWEGFAQ